MKIFNKTAMSIALTAAMIGGVAMTQQVFAAPSGTEGSTGTDEAAVVDGMPYVNANGLGQALIFPYYTVRDGYKSFFNVTNTSEDTIAVKVRFHEGQNSRDALDFDLVMSPNDVWTGWIEDTASGPVVRTADNTCVVGAPNIKGAGQALSKVAYGSEIEGFQDLGPDTIDRTREGYVEMIAMGKAIVDDTSDTATEYTAAGDQIAAAALHNSAGMPADCAFVNEQFVANAPTTLPVSYPFVDDAVVSDPLGNVIGGADVNILGDGNPNAAFMFEGLAKGENPLKGNFSVIAKGKGIGGGNAAVAIADFADTETSGQSLITAQNFPYFLEPSLASRDGIWTDTGLVDVDAALTSSTIINEWAANNPDTGAATDWIVTFPTKGFHVDTRAWDRSVTPAVAGAIGSASTNIQAANNQWRAGDAADTTPNNMILVTPFDQNITSNGAEIEIGLVGYDREEFKGEAVVGNTNPSPYPPGGVTTLSLQGEANLITFGPAGTNNSAFSGENFVLNFDAGATLGNAANNGWAQLSFVAGANEGTETAFANGDDTDTDKITDSQASSLPVVGYVFKSRNQGDSTLSFGQIVGHAFK